MAEMVEAGAERVARILIGSFAPQERSQMIAGVGAPRSRQVKHKRSRFLVIERQRRPRSLDFCCAKQVNSDSSETIGHEHSSRDLPYFCQVAPPAFIGSSWMNHPLSYQMLYMYGRIPSVSSRSGTVRMPAKLALTRW